MAETQNTPIEFNSMSAILKRLDKLFYAINEARRGKQYIEMLEYLSEFFKEISPDMKEEESSALWDEIKSLKNVDPRPQPNFWLIKADELDIKLRRKAKQLGYLTRNIKDVRSAVTEM